MNYRKLSLFIAIFIMSFGFSNVEAQSISDFAGKYKITSIFIGESNGVQNYYGPNGELDLFFKVTSKGKIKASWSAEVEQAPQEEGGDPEELGLIVSVPVTVTGKITSMSKVGDTYIAKAKLTFSDGTTAKIKLKVLKLYSLGKQQLYVKGTATRGELSGIISGLSYRPL